MADDEGSLADAPEAFALGQLGELVGFDRSQTEDAPGGGGFVVGFVVEDAGGRVAQ